MQKNVGIIISNNIFRDEEYFEPKLILEKAGIKTITIANKIQKCTSKFGKIIMPDMLLDAVNTKNFDAILFIGGAGSKDYWHNKKAHEIAQEMFKAKKIIGAICSAVATLAFSGILKNKLVNSFETEREILKQNGGILSDKDCIVDENIVTANGPKSASKFGNEILKLLK